MEHVNEERQGEKQESGQILYFTSLRIDKIKQSAQYQMPAAFLPLIYDGYFRIRRNIVF